MSESMNLNVNQNYSVSFNLAVAILREMCLWPAPTPERPMSNTERKYTKEAEDKCSQIII